MTRIQPNIGNEVSFIDIHNVEDKPFHLRNNPINYRENKTQREGTGRCRI